MIVALATTSIGVVLAQSKDAPKEESIVNVEKDVEEIIEDELDELVDIEDDEPEDKIDKKDDEIVNDKTDDTVSNKPKKDSKPKSESKPKPGKPDTPSKPKPGKPVESQGQTSCKVIPQTTETEYTDLYYPDSEALKNLQFPGVDGEKCTAVVTTTIDGKVTNTKTIVVSEKKMEPRQVLIGTKEDYLLALPSTYAMFTTAAAREAYVRENTVGSVRFTLGTHTSTRGVVIYAVEKFDENGNVMDMYGPEQEGPFYIQGTRVYFK